MSMSARLWAAVAAMGVALVFAGVGLADPSPSGKPTHHHPGASVPRAKPAPRSGAECPSGLHCDFVPAAYAQNSSDPGDYGNYDLADRPADGLAIRYVVVHDTEDGYDDTLAEFQNSHAYVSAHYVIRSSDGHVTQMVPTQDVAWHAGNWWVNSHSVGIENEGFATERDSGTRRGSTVAREADEVPGAALRHPARPRAHHRPRPGAGPVAANQPGMHWDPGPYFDWARFMRLLGAPIKGAHGDGSRASSRSTRTAGRTGRS